MGDILGVSGLPEGYTVVGSENGPPWEEIPPPEMVPGYPPPYDLETIPGPEGGDPGSVYAEIYRTSWGRVLIQSLSVNFGQAEGSYYHPEGAIPVLTFTDPDDFPTTRVEVEGGEDALGEIWAFETDGTVTVTLPEPVEEIPTNRAAVVCTVPLNITTALTDIPDNTPVMGDSGSLAYYKADGTVYFEGSGQMAYDWNGFVRCFQLPEAYRPDPTPTPVRYFVGGMFNIIYIDEDGMVWNASDGDGIAFDGINYRAAS